MLAFPKTRLVCRVWSAVLRLFCSDAFVFSRTYAQYASMNEFTCSEHSIRIRMSKIRSTGNQLLVMRDHGVEPRLLMAQSLVIFLVQLLFLQTKLAFATRFKSKYLATSLQINCKGGGTKKLGGGEARGVQGHSFLLPFRKAWFFLFCIYVGDESTLVAFLVLKCLCYCFLGYLVGEFAKFCGDA